MFKGLFKGSFFITGRNKVVAKVIFLHLSVILFTGGGLPQCMLGCPPRGSRHPPGADTPREQTPPGSRHNPPEQSPSWNQTPPGTDTTPPGADTPPGSRLRYTVYERPVRILLECIPCSICSFSPICCTEFRDNLVNHSPCFVFL